LVAHFILADRVEIAAVVAVVPVVLAVPEQQMAELAERVFQVLLLDRQFVMAVAVAVELVQQLERRRAEVKAEQMEAPLLQMQLQALAAAVAAEAVMRQSMVVKADQESSLLGGYPDKQLIFHNWQTRT
jgi:hypothetical protein